MSTSLLRGARGLQRLICLKYFNVIKQGSTFALGLHAAKNTHYIRKSFKKKLLSIEFCIRKYMGAHVYHPPGPGGSEG